MKKWLPAVLLAATLTGAVPALAQGTPDPIIHAKDHPMHANVFSSRLSKNAYWRGEITRKGYDVAFDEWMRQDHPFEYATYCTQEAKKVTAGFQNTQTYSEFNTLLTKRQDLRSEVQSLGIDVTFADWLRQTHPDLYKKHFGHGMIDPSMNDKQMPRGMKM